MAALRNTFSSRLLGRAALALLVCCAGTAALAQANPQPTDDPAQVAVWLKVQASLFNGRPVQPAPPGMLVLDVPKRAIDAAVVPLAISAQFPAAGSQAGAPRLSKLYLIIDANPSPVSGIFTAAAPQGRTRIETRVRVDGYSFVRAIAETTDGKLFGVTQFVKASGGCSAPPGGDAVLAAQTAGRMALQISGDPKGSEPLTAQLNISHPNHSGMAMDQLTRQFTPAHYVRKVEVKQAGVLLFSADVDFSMSENPSFRFPVSLQGTEALQVDVEDSQGQRFSLQQPLTGVLR